MLSARIAVVLGLSILCASCASLESPEWLHGTWGRSWVGASTGKTIYRGYHFTPHVMRSYNSGDWHRRTTFDRTVIEANDEWFSVHICGVQCDGVGTTVTYVRRDGIVIAEYYRDGYVLGLPDTAASPGREYRRLDSTEAFNWRDWPEVYAEE